MLESDEDEETLQQQYSVSVGQFDADAGQSGESYCAGIAAVKENRRRIVGIDEKN